MLKTRQKPTSRKRVRWTRKRNCWRCWTSCKAKYVNLGSSWQKAKPRSRHLMRTLVSRRLRTISYGALWKDISGRTKNWHLWTRRSLISCSSYRSKLTRISCSSRIARMQSLGLGSLRISPRLSSKIWNWIRKRCNKRIKSCLMTKTH